MKLLLVIISLLFSTSALSANPITWHDLIPKVQAPTETLPQLSASDLTLFQEVLAYKLASERRELTKDETLGYQQRIQRAKKENLDIDHLFDIRNQYLEAQKQAMNTTVKDLPSDEITIQGFLVPLEMDGMKTTKFLLVPTAGACVHTPPPPINQIIVVDFEQGFELQSLEAPVSVSGFLGAKKNNLSVNFSDGNQDIKTGYKLLASDIKTI
ncbi:hypothetical protein JCM19232_510 [Vibrio ishigakensis]|uniref:Lipoprotein n=1 Tax=Vibrio ishigakensis TaxID=1481914 RepID=A0A0B8P6J4_9VIBR|nr:hypothetical protein JCM19232_510 [Vibrio ishigakensis]